MEITTKSINRFWKKVDKSESGCWIWTGALNGKGYGIMTIQGKHILAHRFSLILNNRNEIPTGLFVCHKCDNPKCVNPDHLFLGTARDNADDMYYKGLRSHRDIVILPSDRATTTGERQAKRRLGLDSIAKKWGWGTWSRFETAVIDNVITISID